MALFRTRGFCSGSYGFFLYGTKLVPKKICASNREILVAFRISSKSSDFVAFSVRFRKRAQNTSSCLVYDGISFRN
jgi:hypothetical protein